jgi:hypothetical protein
LRKPINYSKVMDIGIEVDLVSKDKDQRTVFLKEVIDTKDIISFRHWHKGEKDKDVKGDMTLVLLSPKPWDKDPGKPKA